MSGIGGVLLTIAIGFVVGTINGMAGGASLISYPFMLTLGLHPVEAAVTNSIGISSANFFALRSGKFSGKHLLSTYRTLILISVAGTIIGATLLLTLPSRVFEHMVPFLLFGATLTLLIPTKEVRKRRDEHFEKVGIAGSGLYCGYFGPGQGIMVAAILARNPHKDPRTMNSAKNIIVGVTSLMSNIIYAFSGRVHWGLVAALFVGSSLGGTLGGKWANRMSVLFYKSLIMTVGLIASLWLFAKYFL
jgi:uncharacterized membrane protein YfcA